MGETLVLLNRRMVLGGLVAVAAAGSLAACAGSGARPSTQATLKNADGTPVLAELLKPGPLGEKTLGSATAPATIIEYASLTCPYCRKFHLSTYPRVKKELIDTGKVRFIVREFPIGRSAGTAAIVNHCAAGDGYFDLYDKFLTQQNKWTSQEVRPDAIFAIAAQTGMTRQAFDACLANKEIEDGLKLVKERGRTFGVSGTPTFFINGRMFRGPLTFDEVTAAIAQPVT